MQKEKELQRWEILGVCVGPRRIEKREHLRVSKAGRPWSIWNPTE